MLLVRMWHVLSALRPARLSAVLIGLGLAGLGLAGGREALGLRIPLTRLRLPRRGLARMGLQLASHLCMPAALLGLADRKSVV